MYINIYACTYLYTFKHVNMDAVHMEQEVKLGIYKCVICALHLPVCIRRPISPPYSASYVFAKRKIFFCCFKITAATHRYLLQRDSWKGADPLK